MTLGQLLMMGMKMTLGELRSKLTKTTWRDFTKAEYLTIDGIKFYGRCGYFMGRAAVAVKTDAVTIVALIYLNRNKYGDDVFFRYRQLSTDNLRDYSSSMREQYYGYSTGKKEADEYDFGPRIDQPVVIHETETDCEATTCNAEGEGVG